MNVAAMNGVRVPVSAGKGVYVMTRRRCWPSVHFRIVGSDGSPDGQRNPSSPDTGNVHGALIKSLKNAYLLRDVN